MSVDRFDGNCCGVCGRRAIGLGHAPDAYQNEKARIMWICDDQECIQIAKDTYSMKQDEFDRIERMALEDGQKAAEDYCDEIRIYDFRELSLAQAEEFSRRLVAGYRIALKTRLRNEAPF